MAENPENDQSVDFGISPSETGISSSVGSTDGDGLDVKLPDFDHNSAALTVVIDGDDTVEENFSTTAQHGSLDQYVDGKEQLEDDENQFVDAPDRLSIMSVGESTMYVEPGEGPEGDGDGDVVEDVKQVRQLKYELALLQASLEKTAADKEIMAQTHQEESEMLGRELADLRGKLETMANQQLFLNDSGGGLVERLRREEREYDGSEVIESDASLKLMIADCSKSVAVLERALSEQLQSEGTIRELHAVLFTKDQEIESLSAKVDELSVTHDVIASYMDSMQQTLSQSLQESSEGRVERELHLEVVTNKMLASLASVVQLEELSGNDSVERISLLEKSTSRMVEQYNRFISEIDLLKQCLTEVVTEVNMPEETEFGIIFDTVRKELLDRKRSEDSYVEKLNQVENENNNLLEQLFKAKERIDVTDGEVRKVKMEIEQEKTKSATTKEKLGMAVTKGKALVQQRDSLKQSLAEKTNELEKCLLELQEKSNALQAAEILNEELTRSKTLAASLQESLSKRAMSLEEIEKILSQTDIPDRLHSEGTIECVRWLADQRNELLGASVEYDKVKGILVSLNLPEVVASYKLESQISWLGESLSIAEDGIAKLQGELISSTVGIASLESELAEAFDEIDHLKTSLLREKSENDSLQIGLEDLSTKYEAVVEREFQVTSAKDRMARMFFEACGVEDQAEFDEAYVDTATFIEKCVGKLKEQISTTLFESSYVRAEQMQSLLYVRYQEAVLANDILEEEILKNSEMTTIRNEVKRVSGEIIALKYEKDSLQKDLERSDEKSALLREKLSMAVKKGKGLVQEREGLKKSLDEKNTEIEKLKLELQQQESEVSGCRDQITKLTNDLEHASKMEFDLLAMKDQNDQLEKDLLESNSMLDKMEELRKSLDEKNTELEILKLESQQQESVVSGCRDQITKLTNDAEHASKMEFNLLAMKDQKDQLEKYLLESNSMLEKIVESIESVTLPAGSTFEEPVDKVKWLTDCVSEYQNGKANAEKELEKVKDEADALSGRLTDAQSTIRSLENALSDAEKNTVLLAEEMKEVQIGKSFLEQELEKIKEEAGFQDSKFIEVCANVRSLEDALSREQKITSALEEEKKTAFIDKINVEKELEKAKEEAGYEARMLAEAYTTIKSLKEELSQLERSVSVLTEEKNAAQAGMASLERELEKVKGEADSQASTLADLYSSVKSLKDALLTAEENITAVTAGKENAETEVHALNAKLSASMAELAGTHGSLESQSVEIFSLLNRLQMIMNDDNLLLSLARDFKRKFEGLRDMKFLLENIRDKLGEHGSELMQIKSGTEEDLSAAKNFSAYIDNFPNEVDNIETNATDPNNILTYFTKIVDRFNKKNKLLEDKFISFSCSMDELITILLRALRSTRDNIIDMLEPFESLKLEVENLRAYKQAVESTIFTSKKDINMLLSAWSDAAGHLGFQMDNDVVDLSSNLNAKKLNSGLFLETREAIGDAVGQPQKGSGGNEFIEAADILAREVRTQITMLENVKDFTLTAIEDLKNKLKEAKLASESSATEREHSQTRISMLERDFEALQNFCNEMKIKLEDHEAKEDMLKERDAEISLLHRSLATQEHETEGRFLSESQAKALFEKIDQIEILSDESDLGRSEFHNSGPVEKLFHIIDNFTQLQHQTRLLSHDKEELQSSLAVQIDEFERVKKEADSLFRINQDLRRIQIDFSEVQMDLERLVQKFEGNDFVKDKKFDVKGLLTVLENLIKDSIRDCETSQLKAQESGAKMHENQKLVEELSGKVKLLEDSMYSKPALSDHVQERTIFVEPSLPSGSEISEIEDVAAVGRNSVSPVPLAAQVRTVRKGSTDHLALTIDSESDRLINHHETDDDKGHAFKSLNTSGLVPKQGKLIADRIDGIWVSGGRVLMSRPRARIGLIAYSLLLHLWLLGSIL